MSARTIVSDAPAHPHGPRDAPGGRPAGRLYAGTGLGLGRRVLLCDADCRRAVGRLQRAVRAAARSGSRALASVQGPGPLDFSMIGVLLALADPLAREHVSIFAISTHDTDYVLVREADLSRACVALAEAGHTLVDT